MCDKCIEAEQTRNKLQKEIEELKRENSILKLEWRMMKYDLSNAKSEIEYCKQKKDIFCQYVDFNKEVSKVSNARVMTYTSEEKKNTKVFIDNVD